MTFFLSKRYPRIPTTIKTMGVDITTIAYLRFLIMEIGSTIILMAVEAQGVPIQGISGDMSMFFLGGIVFIFLPFGVVFFRFSRGSSRF